jgi:hypothetical protein
MQRTHPGPDQGAAFEVEPSAVASFRERGFALIPRLAEPDEVVRLRAIFDRAFGARAGRAAGDHYDIVGDDGDEGGYGLPTIINPLHYEPELRRLACRDRALRIAQTLLGPSATPSFEHVILKPAYEGSATPWHQDEAYRDPGFDYEEISIWIGLQETTLENGCLAYIPGSHRGEVLDHRPLNDDPRTHAIECVGPFDPATAVQCPLPAGGAAVHCGRTLHYSGPNLTGQARYGYILTFELQPRRRAVPRDFPWLRQRHPANQARKRRWRRRGGFVIAAARKLRGGLWRNPGRLAFEIRRALRALLASDL